MHIFYVASQFEYGKPELGLSFEHSNFFDCLSQMGHDITYFDFTGLMARHGRSAMNRRLLETAKAIKADLMFTCLLADELDQATVRTITENNYCTTFNWFCDDHWRFEIFSKYWAPCFHWVSTTVKGAEAWYHEHKYERVIKTQWAVNPFLYRHQEQAMEHAVSFVGQPHGRRRSTIEAIRKAGIDVKAWGNGWEAGRIATDEMIRVFGVSRINLNFTASSVQAPDARVVRRRAIGNRLVQLPFGHALKSAAVKVARGALNLRRKNTIVPEKTVILPPQIKGRNFEVPGCGGFLLTERADDLESYFIPGQEIAMFEGVDDCVEKIRYYLGQEKERLAVASAGYQRTIREHTYISRFEEIFRHIGLKTEIKGQPGQVDIVK